MDKKMLQMKKLNAENGKNVQNNIPHQIFLSSSRSPLQEQMQRQIVFFSINKI